MPVKLKALEQEVVSLEEVQKTAVLSADFQEKLRKAKRKVRRRRAFLKSSPFFIHIVCLVTFGLMWQHLRTLDRINGIRTAAENVRVSMLEVESGQRGFLLTGNDSYLDDYREHKILLKHRLEVLCLRIPYTAQNKDLCMNLDRLILVKLAEMESTVKLAKEGKLSQALAIVRTDLGFGYMKDITRRLGEIKTEAGPHAHSSSCLIP
jgi:CHASE3 domain sensor protein